jgi:hypothetical protein
MAHINASFRNGTDARSLWTITDVGKNPEEQIFYDYLDSTATVGLHLESDDGEWGKARWEHENIQGYADVKAGSLVDMT